MARCRFSNIGAVLCGFLMVCPALLAQNVGGLPKGNEIISVFDIGSARQNVLDEYLSPNVFRGPALYLGNQKLQAMETDAWYTSTLNKFQFGYLKNKSERGRDITLAYSGHSSWYRLFYENSRFTVLAGPGLVDYFGAVYTMRSTNNPGQVKAYIGASASAMGVWRFELLGLPMALNLSVDFPLVGLNFAPEYGQQYYEIYEYGQLKNTIHFAWPGNLNYINSRLALDIPVGATQLRIGFDGDWFGYNMEGLRCKMYSNTPGIGVVRKLEYKYNGR